MDRNSYIGLGLIFVLLMGYFYINQPSEAELAKQKHYTDSVQASRELAKKQEAAQMAKVQANQDSAQKTILQDSAALLSIYKGFAAAVQGQETFTTIENSDVQLRLSNKGAGIHQVWLKAYKTDARQPVKLFDESRAQHLLYFTADQKRYASNQFYWTLHHKDERSIAYRLYYGGNAYMQMTYSLEEKGYSVKSQLTTHEMGAVLQANNGLTLQMSNDVPLQERDVVEENKKTTLYYQYKDKKADYISETKQEKMALEESTDWVSFKQQFFNSTVICKQGFLKGSTIQSDLPQSTKNIKHLSAVLLLPMNAAQEQAIDLNYFFGPNQYHMLKDQGIGLDKIIPLGWGIFGWINRFMIIPIFNFLQGYLSNYGIIILLLTLIIKTLLLPLVFKSFKSTAKMRLLKPEMDALKEKYKDDVQTQQMENLKLYRQAGVNPLGGCLPMLLQMPILIAVFQFVPSAFEFRQQAFLWADDLSIYDSVWNFGKLPVIDYIYGDHVSLFTLLMTVSTLIYTRMNNQMTGGMNDQMKYISYIMPILFLGFFNKYAAALTYYYFLSNIVTFTQQWAIRKFIDEDALKSQIQESKNKKGDDKKSAFQKRLEEMAKAKDQMKKR